MSTCGAISNVDIQNAIDFFDQNFGIKLRGDGSLQSVPSSSQLDELAKWHNDTTISSGIFMPDIGTFVRKTILAKALMPQSAPDSSIQYIFGNSHGLELSIQGEVIGHKKRVDENPLRTHIGFGLLGCKFKNENIPGSRPSQLVNSDRFQHVFGDHEMYPLDRTKALNGLPQEVLHATSDIVRLGGVVFLVPQLELQFVDAYMVSNSTVEGSSRGMSDAQALATAYKLDRDVIHFALDNYLIKPVFENFQAPVLVASMSMHAPSEEALSIIENLKETNPVITDVEIHEHLTSLESERQSAVLGELHEHHEKIDAMLDAVDRTFEAVHSDAGLHH